MSTAYPDLFADLAAPFLTHEVKQRPQGREMMAYVTARTVENRLDSVVGPENWWDEYNVYQDIVVCHLTIRLPDGREVTKSDATGRGKAKSEDPVKAEFSTALKRAASKFGIGRYLYKDGVVAYDRAPTPSKAAQSGGGPAPLPDWRAEGRANPIPQVYRTPEAHEVSTASTAILAAARGDRAAAQLIARATFGELLQAGASAGPAEAKATAVMDHLAIARTYWPVFFVAALRRAAAEVLNGESGS